MKSVLEKDFGLSKSVFGFRVLLGNPKSEIQNRNPDFPIERTLLIKNIDDRANLQMLNTRLRINQNNLICGAEEKQPRLKKQHRPTQE